ncbi:ribonuclease III domain-containing protein [Xylaria nigripes]|nr:ribonuclease III domain-containing protein [Xylaria nigripes]
MQPRQRILDIGRASFHSYVRYRRIAISIREGCSSFLVPLTSVTSAPSAVVSDTEDISDTKTEKLRNAQEIIKYKFQDETLLWEALQAHGSDVTMLNGRNINEGNKRLAHIGDAIITLAIRHNSYLMGCSTAETNTRLNSQASNFRLSQLCELAGLDACINLNPAQMGSVFPRTSADTMEAIVGAVYLDGGLDKAKSAMKTLDIIGVNEV